MSQWIIDRYNKGQEIYIVFSELHKTLEQALANENVISIGFKNYRKNGKDIVRISLFDYLFNPKWGFAIAFWGEKETYDEYHPEDDETVTYIQAFHEGWEHHIQQMVISKHPLKYLEQFK